MPRQASQKNCSLCNLHAQLQDIAKPKTNPWELQSVAQAGFRKLSSFMQSRCTCNSRTWPTPRRTPPRARVLPRQVSPNFLIYGLYMHNSRTSPSLRRTHRSSTCNLQDIADPKTNTPEGQSAAKAGFTKLSNLWTVVAELQDIAEPKTNPSELQSVAKADFRTLSSLCNRCRIPGHRRVRDRTSPSPKQLGPTRTHPSFRV